MTLIQKMLLSILGLICVPLLGIQLISLVQSTNEFQEVNSRQYITMLQSLGDSFENELDSLSQAALRISLDDNMEIPVKENSSPYAIYAASQVLNKYNSIHPLTSSMGIYYRTEDKVMRHAIINDLKYFSYGFNREGSQGERPSNKHEPDCSQGRAPLRRCSYPSAGALAGRLR